jgi:hypothetical protein
VRRYFEEVVDKSNLDILDEIVTTDCVGATNIAVYRGSDGSPRVHLARRRRMKGITKPCTRELAEAHMREARAVAQG